MAAALALAFQSSHLQDGLAEFLTMIRGCNIIAGKDQLMNPDSAFHAFREASHLATMQNRLSNASQFPVDTNDLDDATASIKAVETLPLTDWEEAFHNVIVRTLEFAYDYPVQGEYSPFWKCWGTYNLNKHIQRLSRSTTCHQDGPTISSSPSSILTIALLKFCWRISLQCRPYSRRFYHLKEWVSKELTPLRHF